MNIKNKGGRLTSLYFFVLLWFRRLKRSCLFGAKCQSVTPPSAYALTRHSHDKNISLFTFWPYLLCLLNRADFQPVLGTNVENIFCCFIFRCVLCPISPRLFICKKYSNRAFGNIYPLEYLFAVCIICLLFIMRYITTVCQ